jgi:BASS family bile acid:Na+ symporter
MTIEAAIKLLLLASIVGNVLALALKARAVETLYLFQEWRLGLRAFVAMFVVVPAVAIAIAWFFELLPAVKIALIALAFSPVPPLLPRKQIKAGGSGSYITGLLVAASLLALIVTPLGFALAGHIFGVSVHIDTLRIARTLAIGIGMPLVLGLIAHRLFGEHVTRYSNVVARLSSILLLVCVATLLIGLAPALWAVMGNGTLVAMIAMILAGLTAGYVLAGDAPELKTALALASAARHPGIAISIATTNFAGEKLAPAAIILFTILNALISIPYLKRLDAAAEE